MKISPTLKFLLSLIFVSAFITSGRADTWAYDPLYKPISKQEIAVSVKDTTETSVERRTMLARAGTNGLIETVVVECSKQLKKTPDEPILRSLYCYALAIASDPADYTPQDKGAWLHQRNLFADAAIDAENVVRGPGAKISFCWQALAFANFKGVGRGYIDGTKRAEKALQLAPEDPYANRLVAMAYLRQTSERPSDPNKVLVYGRHAAQLQPNSRISYYYQAEALFRLKKYQAALVEFKKSWVLLPPKYRRAEDLKRFESWAKAYPKS